MQSHLFKPTPVTVTCLDVGLKKNPRQRVFSHNLLRPEIIMSWDMGTLLYIDDDDDVVAAIQSNCLSIGLSEN